MKNKKIIPIKEFNAFLKTITVYEHVIIYENNITKEVIIQTKGIIVKKMAKLNKLSMGDLEAIGKLIDIKLEPIKRKLEEHSAILEKHSAILEKHSAILEKHSLIFTRNNLK